MLQLPSACLFPVGLSVLVLLALASSSSPSPDKEELPSMVLYDSNDYVKEIEEEEYNRTVIESDDVWIVEFYAPWCAWGWGEGGGARGSCKAALKLPQIARFMLAAL